MTDTRLQLGSMSAALCVNLLIFAGFLLVGMTAPEEKKPDVEFIDADMVELPRLGTKKRDPKLLPDIVQPAPAPPVEKKVASLSRKKKEQFEKPKPKPKPPEAKEKPKPKPKKKPPKTVPKRTKDDAKKRKRTIEDAFKELDSRARDEDDPEGVRSGHALGTSPNEDVRNRYLALLKTLLSRQFRVPNAISNTEMVSLFAKVSFRLTPQGKVKNVTLVTRSKNRLFDQAAVAAVRRFSPSAPLKLPVPKDPKLKKLILGGPTGVRFDGKKLVQQRR